MPETHLQLYRSTWTLSHLCGLKRKAGIFFINILQEYRTNTWKKNKTSCLSRIDLLMIWANLLYRARTPLLLRVSFQESGTAASLPVSTRRLWLATKITIAQQTVDKVRNHQNTLFCIIVDVLEQSTRGPKYYIRCYLYDFRADHGNWQLKSMQPEFHLLYF